MTKDSWIHKNPVLTTIIIVLGLIIFGAIFFFYGNKNSDTSNQLILPESEEVPETPGKPSTIPNLASVRISGGVWNSWDADAEKDGPVIRVVYLDSYGEIINGDGVPIEADVKIYTTDTSDYLYKKDRLVFSAHYSSEQIIPALLYPEIRVKKEEINIKPETDYKYGYVELTIKTQEQGDFSAESDFIVLYEE